MRTIWTWPVLALVILCLVATTGLRAQDNAALAESQRSQQAARQAARQLVLGVLELQLRQLEENRMTRLPVYDDIRTMRDNIDHLVDDEMSRIVELLDRVRSESDAGRRAELLNQARQQIRETVLALTAERERLHRRMQVSRLASRVTQLLELQQRTQASTAQLESLAAGDRLASAILVIEDQRDVNALYGQLVAMLGDVATWSGRDGAVATDALRVLRIAGVDGQLASAEQRLQNTDYDRALQAQTEVVQGLRAVLDAIDRLRGLAASNHKDAMTLVRRMSAEQEALRLDTARSQLNDPAVRDALSDRQQRLHADLGQLEAVLGQLGGAMTYLEQAQNSAHDAIADLFEGERDAALVEQSKVIGGLALIESELQRSAGADTIDRSADELARDVAELERLSEQLDVIGDRQRDASAGAPSPAAAEIEDEVAGQLQSIVRPNLAPAIRTRISEAQAAAATAAAQPSVPAVAEVSQRIERAQAEVRTELADTRRRQKAVQVGELARAAEALERAAAAENEIAAEWASQPIDAARARQMAAEDQIAAAVAQKIARGVATTAPDTARLLDKIPRAFPPSAQPPAADQVSDRSPAAAAIASQLRTAADQLRSRQAETARDLVELAEGQMEAVDQVQRQVEAALARSQQGDPGALDQMIRAQQELDQAAIQQQRAAGRDDAADLLQLLGEVDQLRRAQAAVDRQSGDAGAASSTQLVGSALAQQTVAESAARLAARAQGLAGDQLGAAAQAAAAAARQALTPETHNQPARAAAATAMNQAAQAIRDQLDTARRQRPGPLNPAAQQQTGQHLKTATELVGETDAGVDSALADAARQAAAAETAIESSSDAEAAVARAQQSIDGASRAVADWIDRSAQAQQEAVARQAGSLGALARQAADVDPGSASALRAAETAAAQGTGQPTSPQSAQALQSQLQNGLQRSSAGLAARWQRINNDREIAEALAQLADDQRAAREAIERFAQAMTESSAAAADSPTESQQAAEAAAQALEQATRQFADAQRAIGQGAVEISKQQQVANVPIREGLKQASRLNTDSPADSEAAAQPAEGGAMDESPVQEGETGEPKASSGTAIDDSATTAQGQAAPNQPGAPGEGQSGSGGGQPSQPGQLGTGLVPDSPQVTAEQIAGSEAMERASQALSSGASSSTGSPGAPESPSSSGATDTADASASSDSSSETTQQVASQSDDGSKTRGDAHDGGRRGDISVMPRRLQGAPWIMRLPPELRDAMLSGARRPPPRAYEERLKQYFESIDAGRGDGDRNE